MSIVKSLKSIFLLKQIVCSNLEQILGILNMSFQTRTFQRRPQQSNRRNNIFSPQFNNQSSMSTKLVSPAHRQVLKAQMAIGEFIKSMSNVLIQEERRPRRRGGFRNFNNRNYGTFNRSRFV